jgi:hypothetical protein
MLSGVSPEQFVEEKCSDSKILFHVVVMFVVALTDISKIFEFSQPVILDMKRCVHIVEHKIDIEKHDCGDQQ